MIPLTSRTFFGVIAVSILSFAAPAEFANCRADITLPKIFADHMVLQRNSAVSIWGTAEPAQKLVVRFNGQKFSATADPAGRWSTIIRTECAGGPFQLEIAAETGDPKIIFSDVMVGEVWLCSGQSNMEWPLKNTNNAEQEIEQSKDYGNLRLFTVGKEAAQQPLDNFTKVESWRVCNPKSVKNFSAVAYFFGRELNRELNGIPIGLIDSAWGGTPAEAWTSRAALDAVESFQPLLKHWDEDASPNRHHRPGNLFNGMIAPLAKIKLRGAIWYQGEANNGRGEQYSKLLPTLIDDWRKHFRDPEMPFYFVQLAPFRYSNRPPQALAEVWDAQLKTARTVPNTGMIVTTDIGDIGDIHPRNKQEVGRRLARLVLTKIYSSELPPEKSRLTCCSPIFKSLTIADKKIQLHFEHVGDGLNNRDGERPLTHFLICGADQKFVPANAEINGDTVEVSSPLVEKPIAVRFAWDDTAQPNLINSAGLPASPFRTDDFPLESVGRSY